MPFSLDTFAKLRPVLWHLTYEDNLPAIQASGRLLSAERLRVQAGAAAHEGKRAEAQHLVLNGRPVILRDQQPLHSGNIAFEDGATFEDVLYLLNAHVFFWPGDEAKPVPAGRRHFKRYESEGGLVLKMSTAEVLGLNAAPLFCPFNSGAPRMSGGRKSPRGPSTFLPPCDFTGTSGEVVECVFQGQASLPDTYEIVPLPKALG